MGSLHDADDASMDEALFQFFKKEVCIYICVSFFLFLVFDFFCRR